MPAVPGVPHALSGARRADRDGRLGEYRGDAVCSGKCLGGRTNLIAIFFHNEEGAID